MKIRPTEIASPFGDMRKVSDFACHFRLPHGESEAPFEMVRLREMCGSSERVVVDSRSVLGQLVPGQLVPGQLVPELF